MGREAAPPAGLAELVRLGPEAAALDRAVLRVSRAAGVVAAVLAAAALVGWAADVWWLKDPAHGFSPMMPNAALMLMASGISLTLCTPAGPGRRRRAARAIAAACGALAIASFVEDLSGRDLGIDTLLFRADGPMRPAVPTSLALILSSAAILLLDVRTRRGPTPAELLALGMAALAALTLGGYTFGAVQFYVSHLHPDSVGMAVNTAAALLALAVGIVAARPGSGAMATVMSPLIGGQVVRRMLLVVLAIPLLGYVAVQAQRAGLYEPPGAAVVEAVAGTIVAAAAILAIGGSLNRADADRRWTEQESREWKRFVDRASIGAAFGSLDGRIGRVNEAFARMHGHTVAELEGTLFADVFAPHRRAELAEKIGVAHQRGHCRWESEHLRKDGSAFPVIIDLSDIYDERCRLLYRAAYVQDITEEKRAEVARARLASLVHSADDAIVAKALDGTVLDWNRGAERVYGYTAGEMVGRSITVIVPDDRRAEREALRAKVLRGETVVGFETIRVRKDGRRVPIALTLSPMRDPMDRVVGISTIERDISLRKQIAADLEIARERERERADELARTNTELSASLREKEVLIKEIHHRVKNNLQVIVSLLDLQARRAADAAGREVLRESQSRVRSIALVHEKIYQSSDLRWIDFDAYLQSLLHSLHAMYGAEARGIRLEARRSGVHLGIDTTMHCGLIINELVTNAVKHAFPAGRGGRIEVGLNHDDGGLTLGVEDDGVGFPVGLDFRSSPSLGLSLVRALTKQLGGSIAMNRSSEAGRGTSFAVHFTVPESLPRAA